MLRRGRMRRRKPAPEPLKREIEDSIARQAVKNLRAGVILSSEVVADIIEELVLDIEARDRLLERIRNRLYAIAPPDAPPVNVVADYLEPPLPPSKAR
jgi:hypothetical protein